MSQEPYCDHGPLDACRCLIEQANQSAAAAGQAARELHAERFPAGAEDMREAGDNMQADAENMHVYAHEFDPIGGFVCAECGMPTESEPCKEHQPIAHSRMT